MADDNLNNQGMGDQNKTTQTTSAVDSRPAWMAQLPDALKENQTLGQYKTIGELGNKLLEHEGKLKNAVFIPGENSTAEERNAYNTKMGIPESPEKYRLDKFDIPEFMNYNQENDRKYLEFAHKHGLNQKQAASLHADLMKENINEARELQAVFIERRNRAENELKDLWKTDYNANRELAVRALKMAPEKLLGPEKGAAFSKFINDAQLANDPLFVHFFHALGKAMDSDKSAFGTGAHMGGSIYTEIDKSGRPMLDFNNTPGMGAGNK